MLTIWQYHGDVGAGRHSPIGKEEFVESLLGRIHPIFDGSEKSAYCIILSSYGTFVNRHGPAKLADCRVSQGMSRDDAEKRMGEPSLGWEYSLTGLVGVVVGDEVHLIKSLKAKGPIAIENVKARFYVIATASPSPTVRFEEKGRRLA